MTTASEPTAATARRPWYQSIAGNLLLAFALIVALTVSASLLSLIRFNQIDAVMNRLTGVSLPFVQSSLGVEAKTAELVGAGDRARQGGKRGAALRAHGAPVRPDRPTLERPEQAADDHLGRDDRGTAAATGRRDQHQLSATSTVRPARFCCSVIVATRRSTKSEAANEAALRLLLQVTDDILARIGASVDRARNGQTDAPDLQRDLASLRAAYAARANFQPRHHVLQRDWVHRNSRCPAGASPATRDRRRQPVAEPGDPGLK